MVYVIIWNSYKKVSRDIYYFIGYALEKIIDLSLTINKFVHGDHSVICVIINIRFSSDNCKHGKPGRKNIGQFQVLI